MTRSLREAFLPANWQQQVARVGRATNQPPFGTLRAGSSVSPLPASSSVSRNLHLPSTNLNPPPPLQLLPSNCLQMPTRPSLPTTVASSIPDFGASHRPLPCLNLNIASSPAAGACAHLMKRGRRQSPSIRPPQPWSPWSHHGGFRPTAERAASHRPGHQRTKHAPFDAPHYSTECRPHATAPSDWQRPERCPYRCGCCPAQSSSTAAVGYHAGVQGVSQLSE
jgi:hypothetical protein